LLDRAVQFFEATDDPLHEAHLSFQAGWPLASAAYFEDSLRYHQNAHRKFCQLGARRNAAEVEAWMAYTHAYRGDLASALRSAHSALTSALHEGWHSVGHLALAPCALAVEGDLPFAELLRQLDTPAEPDDFYVTRSIAECHWYCHQERYGEAQQTIENAWAFMKRNLVFNQFFSPVPALFASVLRQRAEKLQQNFPSQSRQLYKKALRMAQFTTCTSRFFPLVGPAAYRELALHKQARGKLMAALRYARTSCRIAEKQDAKFEYAQSLRVQGEIANLLGDPTGKAIVAKADAELQRIREAVRQVRREVDC